MIRNAGDGSLSIYLSVPFFGPSSLGFDTPAFQVLPAVSAGLGVSDISLIDTTGRGVIDIVVTNKLTGQISVLRNNGYGTFDPPTFYRAGTGPSELDTSSGSPEITNKEGTAGVAAGTFQLGGSTGLVAINPDYKSITFLAGLGPGRYANPVALASGIIARLSAWPT